MDMNKIKTALGKSTEAGLKELTAIRERIGQIHDELRWLEDAPLPVEDALANIESFIQKHSTPPKGIENFFYQQKMSSPGFFESSIQFEKVLMNGTPIVNSGKTSIEQVLIPLLGAATMKRALSDLAQQAASEIESGPPLAERPELRRELKNQLYELEIQEEKIIEVAEEISLDGFYRRPDCNPEIVLMMKGDL